MSLNNIDLHPWRSEKVVPLTFVELDLKWQKLQEAINALNAAVNANSAKIITRVMTALSQNNTRTPTEIVGLSFEAEPNSTYIITGGLDIVFSNGLDCRAGMSIPSGSLSCTFITKKNTSNDALISKVSTNNTVVVVSASNKEGHVGVYAVVTTGNVGGTVKFLQLNNASSSSVSTIEKSFITAIKHA